MKRITLIFLTLLLALPVHAECVLKQSTASQSLLIGPFLDSTDGVTAETGLTIANTDIRVSKNGANIIAKNAGGGTHDELGLYTITLDATDTNTVGHLQLAVAATGALPVWLNCLVVEEAVYDNVYAASAVGPLTAAAVNTEADTALTDYDPPTRTELTSDITGLNDLTAAQVNTEVDTALSDIGLDHLVGAAVAGADVTDNSIIAQMVGDDATADWDSFDNTTESLEALRNRGDTAWSTGSGTGLTALANGTAQGGSASTIQLASGESFADDVPNGNTVCIHTGTGAGQCRPVSDYVGATDTATVEPDWTTNPSTDSQYEMILGSVNVSMWDGADITTTLETAASVRAEMDSNSTQLAAIVADTNELQTDNVPGLLATAQSDLDTITGTGGVNLADNSITAAKIATDAIGATEIAANAITASELADNAIDAGVIATDAIGAAEIAASAIGASELATDAIGATEIATNAIGAAELAADSITSSEIATDAIGAAELAADAVSEVWAMSCEDQGGGISCQGVMSLLLAEAMGTCTYTAGTRTFVCSDPSGTETRFTLVYGSELDGDRTSSTPAPMTP